MNEEFNPFQSPQTLHAPLPQMAMPGGIFPFASGHTRAVWSIALLAIVCVVDIVGTGAAVSQYFLLDRIKAGEKFDKGEAEDNDSRLTLIGGVDAVCIIAAIVPFLMWTHRACRNLPALGGRQLRFRPGWAVGWYFVPLANLWMPYLVTAEIWRESDPAQRSLDGSVDLKRASPLVGFWWASFVAKQIAARAIIAMDSRSEGQTIDWFVMLSYVVIAAYAAEFISGILAIFVIRGIDRNQQAKYELILNEPTVI